MKKNLMYGIVLLLLFATYNVCLFLLDKNLYTSFWISYAFIVLAFLCLCFGIFFATGKKRRKQVVGMPIITLCFLYFILQFVLGTVLMCFNISFVASFIPQLIAFVLFAVCFIPALLSDKNYKSNE